MCLPWWRRRMKRWEVRDEARCTVSKSISGQGLRILRNAREVLQREGIETVFALPFEGEQIPEMPQEFNFIDLRSALPDADALLCFGGDGTILHCAREATHYHVPILGINVGNVGFMAELESGEMELLSRLRTDEFRIEERMMLDVRVYRAGREVFRELSLNDAVVTKGRGGAGHLRGGFLRRAWR